MIFLNNEVNLVADCFSRLDRSMSSLITILGDAPHNDYLLLKKAVESRSLALSVISRDELKKKEFSADLPLGFISFLPPSRELVLELFRSLPVGSGECLPIFQFINSEIPPFIVDFPILGVFEVPLNESAAFNMISAISRSSVVNAQNSRMISEVVKYRNEKMNLVQIGTALSKENDLQKLLELILMTSRRILCADAGSIYLRERNSPGGSFNDTLRFKVAQNDSVNLGRVSEYSVPINNNFIAGYVAQTARSLNIDDVDRLDDSVPYRTTRDFEKKFSYKIKSMLTVPLKNQEGEVVGVLQLINRKADASTKLTLENVDSQVDVFSLSDEEFVQSVASQTAVSIERAQLHENIKAIFEGFLSSSIAAIEERDKVTSGHSKRVTSYVTAFLDAAQKDSSCPYFELGNNPEKRRQIQFAALLHDIGKIGVPEYLLTKEKKLASGEFDNLMSRMDFVELQLALTPSKVSGWISMQETARDREFLKEVNGCGFLTDQMYQKLSTIREKTYTSIEGQVRRFLSDDEWKMLSIPAGNLTSEERGLINSHASSTFRILSKIPWAGNLQQIPVIASQHHERMDGSGYPCKLSKDHILLESRILAVVDIYEALVAQDRPYKPKTDPEKALKILTEEAAKGHLDQNVVTFFIEKEIFSALDKQAAV